MKELSIGANLAWQLTAQEAAAARYQYIGPDHLWWTPLVRQKKGLF